MKRTIAAFISLLLTSSFSCARRASAQSLETLAPVPVEQAAAAAPVEAVVPLEAAAVALPMAAEAPLMSARQAEGSLAAVDDLHALIASQDAGSPAASASLSHFFEAAPALSADRENGAELQEFIWSERIVPSAYPGALPQSNGGWRNGLKALRAILTAGKSFDHDGDELPRGHSFKVLHPFGSVLKVRYHALPGHPYTGLFADGNVPGLMRLSLGAAPNSGKFIPGTAVKLFIDGHPSANAVFLGRKTGVDGQQPDRNFFAQAFTNLLPKPRAFATKLAAFVLGLFNRGNALEIPVDHFALRSADGTAAQDPRAPYRLLLQPAPGLGNASDTTKDFREELADLPVGKIFDVYAAEGPSATPVKIGEIEATSKPVASEYGDRGLFFRHRRGLPARGG